MRRNIFIRNKRRKKREINDSERKKIHEKKKEFIEK